MRLKIILILVVELEQLLQQQGKQQHLDMVRIWRILKFSYIRRNSPWMGDAIYCAKSFIRDEPFAVLLGDDVVYNHKDRA